MKTYLVVTDAGDFKIEAEDMDVWTDGVLRFYHANPPQTAAASSSWLSVVDTELKTEVIA